MRNTLWYSIVQYNFGCHYLSLYLDRMKKSKQAIAIMLLISSLSGIFGWKYWEPIAFIACIVMAVMQLLSMAAKVLQLNDESFTKVAELKSLYTTTARKLEEIWIDLNVKKIDEAAAATRYNSVMETKDDIEKIDNSIDIKQNKKLLIETKTINDTYLNKFKEL